MFFFSAEAPRTEETQETQETQEIEDIGDLNVTRNGLCRSCAMPRFFQFAGQCRSFAVVFACCL